MSTVIWSTAPHFFSAVNREFRFTVDLCADPENTKCERFFSRGESLCRPWNGWDGWAWLNPPYGAEIKWWMQHAALSGSQIVALIPSRTNAPWWHNYVLREARELRFIRRKLPFVSSNGKKGVLSFGSVLAIFPNPEHLPVICKSWDWRA